METADDMTAHDQGYDAYLSGKDESANPYDPNTQALSCTSWNDGWMEAQSDGEADWGDD